MGMTIDEAIEFKKNGYHTPLSSFKNTDDMNAQISKCAEYDRLVLDTMRKYQKIEQILKDIPYGGDVTVRRIQEVAEDGNDD